MATQLEADGQAIAVKVGFAAEAAFVGNGALVAVQDEPRRYSNNPWKLPDESW
jgi:hypothetical protein